MASPGSQYVFFTTGQAVNVVLTTDGTNLPQGDPSKFNIELVTNPPNGTNFNVAFTQGYQTAVLLPGGTGQTAQLLAGNYGIQDIGSNDSITLLSNGSQTVIGAKGDTITGGSGNDLLNAIAGPELVLVGTGATTVFGGVGDTIVGSTGTVVIDGSAGSQSISGGNGQSTIFGGAGDTISGSGGFGASTIHGAQNDTITAGFGSDVIDATAGNQLINGSGGSMTVYGGAGDNINIGSGDTYVDGSAGNMIINVGSQGTDSIIGSIAKAAFRGPDTINGGAATVQIAGLGSGDILNFANQTGNATVNATAGNNTITLGSGFVQLFAGIGDNVTMGSGAQQVSAVSGGAKIVVGTTGGSDSILGSVVHVAGAGADTLVGGGANVLVQGLGAGDFVSFGNQTGGATVNGTGGNVTIIMGSGAGSVFGGVGDAVFLGSGTQYVDGLLGGESIAVGSAGGIDSIIGSTARISGAGVDTLTGGAAAVSVIGLGVGDIVNFSAQTGAAVVNATAGNNVVTLGSGAASVYGGVGGSIKFGSGQQVGTAVGGGETITVGTAGGSDTIIGSVTPVLGAGVDTLIGGGATAIVSGLGKGDIVNFQGQTGLAVINAASSNVITLGAGTASIFGGANSTFNLGTGNQYLDASNSPGSLIDLGSAGTETIIGNTVSGAGGDTIHGGNTNLIYNVGIGRDLIDLTGTTGTAVINSFGVDTAPTKDTIVAGNGANSVFGGAGDRIAVGQGAGGTDLWSHSTTISGASIGFGTNDSISAVTYGGGPGQITVNGALSPSTAKVTVTGFSETGGTPTDFLFYQGEGAGTTQDIVTTSSQVTVNGAASTQFTLPDGTVMTLVGVAKVDFNTGFFK